MPGSAGSKYGIIGDGVPVEKGKVMEKLEQSDANELARAFLFMEDTGISPYRMVNLLWSLDWSHAESPYRQILADHFSKKTSNQTAWESALESIQAAMKILKCGE